MEHRVRLHGKRWRVRWRENGSLFRRSFRTRAEAETFAASLDAELNARRTAAAQRATPLSAAEIVEAYYEKRRRRLQPSTQHHYEQIMRKHILPKIGHLSARDLADDPSPLQDFYDELPPTTALHAHQILRPAFQYAVDHRRLDRNPCSIARPPRRRRPERRIPTADEVAKIVLAAREHDQTFGLVRL